MLAQQVAAHGLRGKAVPIHHCGSGWAERPLPRSRRIPRPKTAIRGFFRQFAANDVPATKKASGPVVQDPKRRLTAIFAGGAEERILSSWHSLTQSNCYAIPNLGAAVRPRPGINAYGDSSAIHSPDMGSKIAALVLFVALNSVVAAGWPRNIRLALQIAVDEISADRNAASVLKDLHVSANPVSQYK